MDYPLGLLEAMRQTLEDEARAQRRAEARARARRR